MHITRFTLAALLAFPMSASTLLAAAPASADCTNAGDVSFCSEAGMGDSGVTSLPYYPYPCEYDWYCTDGGMSVLFDTNSGGLNSTRDQRGGSYLDRH